MLKYDLLLRAARREHTERTPVWLMRQAGRFDPEYRKIREGSGLPLEELFRQPELAAEISLLPRRLGVDAIIYFQDILTPLAPMGARFVFRPGPMLDQPLRTADDIRALNSYDAASELPFISQSLQLVKKALDGALPLLGFAGAPLTLACFMIEGRSPGGKAGHTRALLHEHPALMHELLNKLTEMTAEYLSIQIDAGADAVQLFESAADLFSPEEYEQFAHPYHSKVFAQLAGRAPTILFVKNQPFVELMASSGADVLSIGVNVDLTTAQSDFGDRVAFQGNVDHNLLVDGSFEEIDRAVLDCIEAGGSRGHILNLSSGLDKDTPFENVCRFIETAKGISGPGGKELKRHG